MKKSLLAWSFFVVLFIGAVKEAAATHTMGVDMTYECLGPGQYRIVLQVYRDCRGIAMVNFHQINYSSVQCGVSGFIDVHQVSVEDITPVCELDSSDACNGGGTAYGVEKYTFLGILTLPVGCGNDWVLSWELCCRNGAITNLLDPLNETVYIDICLDNTLSPCNNSPFFLNNPIPFYCLNQPVFYNHGVIDVDGDSLVFSAGTSLSNGGVSVAYQQGYGGNAPFNTSVGNPYAIDPISGDISYTPDALQIAVAAIRVDEYRNGVHIGCVVRDMQFTIINCNNELPTLSGINGTDTFNITISTCSDTCFDVFTNDTDPADNLSLSWNNGIPSGSFTSTNAQHPVGTFCWAPTDLDVGVHYFTLIVQDDHCPIVGTNIRSYIIRVVPSLDPPVSAGIDTVICYGSSANLEATVIGGSPSGFTWSDGNNTWNTQSITVSPVSTASYSVTAFYPDGCRKTDAVTVVVSDPLITFASPNVVQCDVGPVNLFANTNAVNPTFNWSPTTGLSCTNCPNPSLTPVSATQYCVSLTDFYNCPGNNACIQVLINTPINPSLVNTNSVICFGENNGLAQLAASGGTPPYQYSINGINFQSSGIFNALSAGNYTAVIRDALLCDTTVAFTIYQPAQFNASISNIADIICFGGNTGSVQLSATGGTPPYQYSLNGAIFQSTGTFNNLTAGNYTATVRDARLCTVTLPFSISQPAQISIALANAVSPNCFGGNDGSAQLSASGGTTPYEYSINGFNFQPSGTFNGLTANGYTATVRDANSCMAIVQFTINQPNHFTFSVVSFTDVSCAGSSDGSVQLSAVGGTPPYQYSMNGLNFQAAQGFNNLNPGTYSATVRDANSCTASVPFTIAQKPTLNINIVNSDSVKCFGGNDGLIELVAAGGTFPYQFSINGTNFQNSAVFNTLNAGSYTASVRDANLCIATIPFNIHQPSVLSPHVVNTISARCAGSIDGSVLLGANGGTFPYVYSINGVNFQTSESFDSLLAGNYTATVQDANLCSAVIPFIIQAASALALSVSNITNVSCYGVSDGAIQLTTSGGTSPYQYSIDGINFQISSSFGLLSPAAFIVTVRDANLCIATLPFTITEPNLLAGSIINLSDVICNSGNSGTVQLSPSGGTAPYQYSLGGANFQGSGSFNGLSANNYMATIRDAHSCEDTVQFDISEPPLLSISVAASDSVTCFGGNDGSIELFASGGVLPYLYSLDGVNFQTSPAFTSLSAGSYTGVVSDANLCEAQISFNVNQPARLNLTVVSVTDVTCYGGNDGSATIQISGGISPYVARLGSITLSSAPYTFSALSANTYIITATDANNCTGSVSAAVNQAAQVVLATANITPVTCYRGNDGSVTLNAAGGIAPYLFSLDNSLPGLNTTFNNLSFGLHSAQVTDANQCSNVLQVVIPQPQQTTFITPSATEPTCFGRIDGAVSLSVAGTGGPWTFVWSTGYTTQNISGLASGYYRVTVNDANNCNSTVDSIHVNQPALLEVTTSAQNLSCFTANDGSISAVITGGSAPYSCIWNNGVSGRQLTSVSPGTYTVTVTDNNNCTASAPAAQVTEPALLALSTTVINNVSCPGFSDGSIEANTSGGTPPYVYAWNNSIGNSALNANIPAGVYLVTVTDANLCSTSSMNSTIDLPGIIISGNVRNVLCEPLQNGSINLSVQTQYPPATYSWSNGANTEDIYDLNTDYYSVTVTDANNCVNDTLFTVVNDEAFSLSVSPPFSRITLGDSVDLVAAGRGGNIASIVWEPASWLSCNTCTSPAAAPPHPVYYTATAVSDSGCVASDRANIVVDGEHVIFIPNVFTPDGRQNNDFFEVYGNKDAWTDFKVMVFDRLGEKMFDSNDKYFKWDGTYKGTPCAPQVFVYIIKVAFADGYYDQLRKGSVTLLR